MIGIIWGNFTGEGSEQTLEPWVVQIIIIIITGILLIILGIVIRWGVKKIIKSKPPLEISLIYNYLWTATYSNKEEDNFFRDNPQYDRRKKYTILSLEPPGEGNFFNTYKREWFISYDNTNDFERHGKKGVKLRYNLAKSKGINLNPCYYVKERPKVWTIFYFEDDYKHNHWCYCKHFYYDQNYEYRWWEEKPQIRNKLTGLRLLKSKECKNCPFEKKWKKGEFN